MATNINMTNPTGTPATLQLPDGTSITTSPAGVASVSSAWVNYLLAAGWSFTAYPGT
jgi:hypothetical protein